jgi:hypothetical protein
MAKALDLIIPLARFICTPISNSKRYLAHAVTKGTMSHITYRLHVLVCKLAQNNYSGERRGLYRMERCMKRNDQRKPDITQSTGLFNLWFFVNWATIRLYMYIFLNILPKSYGFIFRKSQPYSWLPISDFRFILAISWNLCGTSRVAGSLAHWYRSAGGDINVCAPPGKRSPVYQPVASE